MNPINLDYPSKITKLPGLKSPENGQSSGKIKLKEISKAYKIKIGSEDHLERHPSLTKIKPKKQSSDYLGIKGLLSHHIKSESEHKLFKNMILVGSVDELK